MSWIPAACKHLFSVVVLLVAVAMYNRRVSRCICTPCWVSVCISKFSPHPSFVFCRKKRLMILAWVIPHHRCRVKRLHNTEFKLFSFPRQQPWSYHLPHLHLNKQVSLLQGPICASPAVNFIKFNSLDPITHCFHLIVSDKRPRCRLSIHLSSEISPSISLSQRVGGLNHGGVCTAHL